MKFKVGDRVKVRKDLKNNAFYGGNRVNEEMFMHRGQILTIRAIDGKNYLMEEDNWHWNDEMLENKDYTYEDLKKSPIGTKITFKNRKLFVKNGEDKFESPDDFTYIDYFKDLTNYEFGKIIKIEEPEYKTVYESKVEILDETEKRYLRGVIRPFRDKVTYIRKFVYSTGDAKIDIVVENWYICLPTFPKNQMYKNMEDDKEYTLEELGL